ncbi:MAG: hypothetical protein U1C70_07980 [Sediminibacterium sp.]|nr:hypothetical protein [Sediminibacterium sp.]MDZ4071746.1 hypothetical protein [Sediminibacterium sp.]
MKKKISIVTVMCSIIIIGSSFIQSETQKSITRGKEVYGLYCQNWYMEN